MRQAAARTRCESNLKQIGIALQQYHDNHHAFPPAADAAKVPPPFPYLSWRGRLLPYVEQDSLWHQTEAAFESGARFTSNPPHVGLATVVPLFTCPGDSRTLSLHPDPETGMPIAVTSYLGVAGRDAYSADGVLYFRSRVQISDISDGTTCTIAVGERPPSPDFRFGWWYAGTGCNGSGATDSYLGVRDINPVVQNCDIGPYHFVSTTLSDYCGTFHFWSTHGPGANFLFADGSVRFLPYSADAILPALASRAAGDTVALD